MPKAQNKNDLIGFFNEEYKNLKGYVNSRITESADRDAEDILQDVAVKLLTRDSSSPITNVAAFVYGSIRNKIIDIMRKGEKKINENPEKKVEVGSLVEMLYDETEEKFSDELKEALKQAISALKPSYKAVIIAIDFQGYTYKELSAETGEPEGTLMSRRHRALSILYKKLEKVKEVELNTI